MSLPRAPSTRRALLVALLLVAPLAAAGAALASPAPIAVCPPCDRSFEAATQSHGVGSEVERSEATVRVHRNGSATWTVENRLANASAADRLRGDDSLARSVAGDSFGARYGGDVGTELLDARVEGETFVLRYRTDGVTEPGPGGTTVVTYFREEPGAYVYTGLGADRLTVVAPEGTALARGFGEPSDDGRRMTATSFPRVADGPFVVLAPADHPAPRALGSLAVAGELWTVVLRNLALFVAVPGVVFAGGLLWVHRLGGPPEAARSPGSVGTLVATVGVSIAAAILWVERPWTGFVSTQAAFGLSFGATLVGVGLFAASRFRTAATYRRLLVGALLVGAATTAATVALGDGGVAGMLRSVLVAPVALLGCLPLGYAAGRGDRILTRRTGVLVVGPVVAALAVIAPVRSLGGTLFLLMPILLTALALAGVVLAAPLYWLGGTLAAARPDSSSGNAPGRG